jgi:hypothetical protein
MRSFVQFRFEGAVRRVINFVKFERSGSKLTSGCRAQHVACKVKYVVN